MCFGWNWPKPPASGRNKPPRCGCAEGFVQEQALSEGRDTGALLGLPAAADFWGGGGAVLYLQS